MLSDVQLMLSLKLSLTRDIVDWPDAKQGENTILLTLAGVDLAVWNDGYAAKLPIAAGGNVTVDFRNWTDLLFEAGKSFDKVFTIALQCTPADPTLTGVMLEVSPGAANPLQWFFRTAGEGVRLAADEVMVLSKPATATVGYTVDATHRNLLFANTGADDLVATVIVLGGHP